MSKLEITISEKGTDPPYNHLTLTGRTGAFIVIKKRPGDIEIYSITGLLRFYLYVAGKYRKLLTKNKAK